LLSAKALPTLRVSSPADAPTAEQRRRRSAVVVFISVMVEPTK
jgi:hypothetical protein